MSFVLFSIQFVALYLLQARYLFGGDSSEYSVVASTWSIPHPPGYPFFSFFANIFRIVFFFLPLNTRVNLLSIIPTVIASFIIYKIVQRLTNNNFVAYFSSFIYLILFPVWLYAEVPEVFALNSALILAITYFILLFRETGKPHFLSLGFFFLGICVAHHHTFIIFLPGWYLLAGKGFIRSYKQNPLKNTLLFIAGVSFYLYAPIASHFKPPIDWENASDLSGFFRLVTRASYGTFKAFSSSVPNLLNQILDALLITVFIIQDFRFIGIVLILLGLWDMKKKHKPFFSFVSISVLVYLIFFFYSNFPLQSSFMVATYERFLIAFYALLMFPFAFGLAYALKIFKQFTNAILRNSSLRKIALKSFYIFLIIYGLIIAQTSYKNILHLRNEESFETFAKNILDTAPRNAIVGMRTDVGFFTTSYFYFIKGSRKDLVFIFPDLLGREYYQKKVKEQYPFLFHPKTGLDKKRYLEQFLRKNSEKRVILFENQSEQGVWAPNGLLWRYFIDEKTLKENFAGIVRINLALWKNTYGFPRDFSEYGKILYVDSIQSTYVQMMAIYAEFLRVNSHYKEALTFLRLLPNNATHRSSDIDKIYLAIYTQLKECVKGKTYEERVVKNTDSLDMTDLSIVLKYYYHCDPENPNIYPMLKLYNEKKTQKNIPLEKL